MDHTVFNPEPTSTGIRISVNRIISHSSAIRELDNGRYDKRLVDGMNILSCIMEAVESDWLTLTIEQQIIVWRWLLAAVFITEELEKNGTVDVPNDEGGVDTAVIYSGERGSISVYPGPERFALANHIEAGAIEKYGPDLGQQLALRMYQDMVVADDDSGFRLSAMGREGFNLLNDGFIEQIQTEGMPGVPVMH